jgi:hypothetical protein
MKTKIRTLITVCILGFVGVLNSNAAVLNSERVAKSESFQFVLSEDFEANIDFQKEAQLVTKLVADREEAKATKQVIERNNGFAAEVTNSFENDLAIGTNDEITDFRKEAQSVIRSIANREEGLAIQKLVEQGRL